MKQITLAQKYDIANNLDTIFDLIRVRFNKEIHYFSEFGSRIVDLDFYYFDKKEAATLKDMLNEVLKDYVLDLNCDLSEAMEDGDVINDLFYLLQDDFASRDVDKNLKSKFNVTIHD